MRRWLYVLFVIELQGRVVKGCALMDSGATNNFIDQQFVERYHILTLQKDSPRKLHVACHRRGYTAQIYDWRLLARGTGAGGLGAGADGHKDGECTWVECDLGVDGLHSVMSLAVSYVL
jgi:hypothetical protein